MDIRPYLPTYLVEKLVHKCIFPNKKVWSNLPFDVLRLIFNKLKGNKDAFARVCRSWRMIAGEEIFLLFKCFGPKSVLLILPHRTELAKIYMVNLGYCISPWKNNDDNDDNDNGIMVKEGVSFSPLTQSQIISSCRGGWILLLERETNDLQLWSPLFDTRIRLPYFQSRVIKAATFFGEFGIGVAVISEDGKLAFVKYGDPKWSLLKEGQYEYEDLISSKDSILALTKNGESISFEAWNFEGTNILNVKIDLPHDMEESKEPQNYRYKLYVADWEGRLFLAVRWLRRFVSSSGRRNNFEVYQTVNFYVYFLDDDKKGWNRVESLGDRSLFIGKNQTIMLRAERFEECGKNSIYFTNHYWIRILKKTGFDESEREHFSDFGSFCLEDSRVKRCRDEFFYFLPTFWIISGV